MDFTPNYKSVFSRAWMPWGVVLEVEGKVIALGEGVALCVHGWLGADSRYGRLWPRSETFAGTLERITGEISVGQWWTPIPHFPSQQSAVEHWCEALV